MIMLKNIRGSENENTLGRGHGEGGHDDTGFSSPRRRSEVVPRCPRSGPSFPIWTPDTLESVEATNRLARPLVLVVFPPSVPDLRPWGIVNILFEKTTATALGVSVKERWISAFDPRSSEFLSFCLSALCILAHTRLLPSPFSSCSIPGVDMES